MRRFATAPVLVALTCMLAAGGRCRRQTARSLNFYGVPGLIDMPSGASAARWRSCRHRGRSFSGIQRTTLSFQFSPRLSRQLPLCQLRQLECRRLHRLLRPQLRPALPAVRRRPLPAGGHPRAAGLPRHRDLVGGIRRRHQALRRPADGHRRPRLGAAGQLRHASAHHSAPRPGRLRPAPAARRIPENWFRGDVAPFAGIEYQATDRLTLKLEYSSDIYDHRGRRARHPRPPEPVQLRRRIPGVAQTSRLGRLLPLRQHLRAFGAADAEPARARRLPGTLAGRAAAGASRATGADKPGWGTDWTAAPANLVTLRQATAKAMAEEGMQLEAMSITGGTRHVAAAQPALRCRTDGAGPCLPGADLYPAALGRDPHRGAGGRWHPGLGGDPAPHATSRRWKTPPTAPRQASRAPTIARLRHGGWPPATRCRGIYPRFILVDPAVAVVVALRPATPAALSTSVSARGPATKSRRG